jgi:hypothetical protein
MAGQGTMLEGYSYRVSARFGSRVWVTVDDGMVAVTGPRVPLTLYRTWIVVQAVLLVSAVAALVTAVILWDWRFLVAAAVLLVTHGVAGGVGAGCMWEMMNLVAFGQGARGDTATFSLADVKDVRIGTGWARRGMWLLLLPYFKGIDSMAQGLAVSFVAPDGTPNGGVYALHMRTPEEARALAALLQQERPLGAQVEA